MNISDKLKELEALQGRVAKDFRDLIAKTNRDEMGLEISRLGNENDEFKKRSTELSKRLKSIEADNSSLRQQLFQQLLDEKTNFLNLTSRKLKSYFGESDRGVDDRLTALQKSVRSELGRLEIFSEKLVHSKKENFLNRIDILKTDLDAEIESQKQDEKAARLKLLKGADAVFDASKNQPLDEKSVRDRLKLNRLEQNIGLKVFGGLGALMISIGLGFLFYQFSGNTNFTTSALTIGALVILLAGNFAIIKRYGAFGRILMGIGSAMLYTAIIYAHVKPVPPLIGFWWAGALSALVTALVVLMAIIHRSQIIMSFSLVGGAIPVYFYMIFRSFIEAPLGLTDFDCNLIFGFLMILQSGILAVSLWQHWKWTKVLSYLPFLPALLIVAFLHSKPWMGLVMTTSSLLLFQFAILITPAIKRKMLHWSELSVLAINTALSSSLIFGFMELMEKDGFMGLAAFVMVLIYAGIAFLYHWKRPEDRATFIILLSSVLVFAFSAIPLQFGAQWNMIGWSLMGLLLIISGSRLKQHLLSLFGALCFFASVGYFIVYDIFVQLLFVLPSGSLHLFSAKFSLLVAGVIAIYSLYQYSEVKGELPRWVARSFLLEIGKIAAYLVSLIYLFWMGYYLIVATGLSLKLGNDSILRWLLITGRVLFSGLLGVVVSTVPFIRDGAGKGLRIASTVISSIFLVVLMVDVDVLSSRFSELIGIQFLFALLTVCLTLVSLFNFYLMLRQFHLDEKLSSSMLWFLTGLGATVTTTLFNLTQIDTEGVTSVVIAVTYAVLALLFIIVGFLKASFPLRIAGMASFVLAMFIAIFRIVWNSGNLTRSFSFLALGILSVAVVFVYSIVERKLEKVFDKEESDV